MVATLPTIPPPPFRDVELGPLTLHVYGLLIGIGIVLALQLTERLARRDGVRAEGLLPVLLPSIAMGFVGARLYHVLSEPLRYAREPLDILKVWEGGLGIWGAIAAGAVTAMVLAPRHGVDRRRLLDAAAPACALAQAIGRWGNYANQELFGRPTSLPWALEVDPAHRPERYAESSTFHPTFLYESLGLLGIVALLTVLALRWDTRPRGILFAMYVALYSTIRFFVEGLRVDPAHEFGPLRQNEWLALVLATGAVAIAATMILRARRGRASAPPRGHAG